MPRIKHKYLITVGNNIRAMRTEAGYSQESLADICGFERSYMGRIERGEQNMGLLTYAKVCLALRCNPGVILPEFSQLKRLLK